MPERGIERSAGMDWDSVLLGEEGRSALCDCDLARVQRCARHGLLWKRQLDDSLSSLPVFSFFFLSSCGLGGAGLEPARVGADAGSGSTVELTLKRYDVANLTSAEANGSHSIHRVLLQRRRSLLQTLRLLTNPRLLP